MGTQARKVDATLKYVAAANGTAKLRCVSKAITTEDLSTLKPNICGTIDRNEIIEVVESATDPGTGSTRLRLATDRWVSLVSKKGRLLFEPETRTSRWGDMGIAGSLTKRVLQQQQKQVEVTGEAVEAQSQVGEQEAQSGEVAAVNGMIDAGFNDLQKAVQTIFRLRGEISSLKETHQADLSAAAAAVTATAEAARISNDALFEETVEPQRILIERLHATELALRSQLDDMRQEHDAYIDAIGKNRKTISMLRKTLDLAKHENELLKHERNDAGLGSQDRTENAEINDDESNYTDCEEGSP